MTLVTQGQVLEATLTLKGGERVTLTETRFAVVPLEQTARRGEDPAAEPLREPLREPLLEPGEERSPVLFPTLPAEPESEAAAQGSMRLAPIAPLSPTMEPLRPIPPAPPEPPDPPSALDGEDWTSDMPEGQDADGLPSKEQLERQLEEMVARSLRELGSRVLTSDLSSKRVHDTRQVHEEAIRQAQTEAEAIMRLASLEAQKALEKAREELNRAQQALEAAQRADSDRSHNTAAESEDEADRPRRESRRTARQDAEAAREAQAAQREAIQEAREAMREAEEEARSLPGGSP